MEGDVGSALTKKCRNAKIEKTAALLEYLAIMTDVEIPEDGEGTTEKEAENELYHGV